MSRNCHGQWPRNMPEAAAAPGAAFGRLQALADSSSKQSQAPRSAAVLLSLASCHWPVLLPPGGDGALVPLGHPPARRPAPPPAHPAAPESACTGPRQRLSRPGPASRQRPPPPVRRHPRHPEPPGHLPVAGAGLDQLRRSQPHLLAAGPFRGGQPAAIGVPHGSGIARCAGRHQSQSPQLKIFLGGERPVAR